MNTGSEPYKCSDIDFDNNIKAREGHLKDDFEEYVSNFWATYGNNDIDVVIDVTNDT